MYLDRSINNEVGKSKPNTGSEVRKLYRGDKTSAR